MWVLGSRSCSEMYLKYIVEDTNGDRWWMDDTIYLCGLIWL